MLGFVNEQPAAATRPASITVGLFARTPASTSSIGRQIAQRHVGVRGASTELLPIQTVIDLPKGTTKIGLGTETFYESELQGEVVMSASLSATALPAL